VCLGLSGSGFVVRRKVQSIDLSVNLLWVAWGWIEWSGLVKLNIVVVDCWKVDGDRDGQLRGNGGVACKDASEWAWPEIAIRF
jgi:hypothetical protein